MQAPPGFRARGRPQALLLFEEGAPPGWQQNRPRGAARRRLEGSRRPEGGRRPGGGGRPEGGGGCGRPERSAKRSGSCPPPALHGPPPEQPEPALERPAMVPLVGCWWKSPGIPKEQLVQVLRKARTKVEQDRAVMLLRRFDPSPRHDLDSEGVKANITPIEFAAKQGFVCFRCDKVYQTYYAANWTTTEGPRQICHGCHKEFLDREEAEMKLFNPFAALAGAS